MTTTVRFVLSYDFLNRIEDIFPMKINIVVTDVVNDVTNSRKSVNTCVVITLLSHDVIHLKTSTSNDKYHIHKYFLCIFNAMGSNGLLKMKKPWSSQL